MDLNTFFLILIPILIIIFIIISITALTYIIIVFIRGNRRINKDIKEKEEKFFKKEKENLDK